MNKRVLVVNKFYYARGGDCVCTLNLERLLKSKGWKVAVYAMNYPENIESEWSQYFTSEIGFSGVIGAKIAAAKRLLGYGDIRSSFKKLLNDFRPDVVHLQNIHSYLSPILAKLAKDFGCRVVWTLHDYKLLCPSYSCLREGKPCELCFNDKSNVLKKRCMKGSFVASVLAYMEALKWNRTWIERYVDFFVCPSAFMAQKMEQGGFDKSKLKVICNFVDPIKLDVLKNMPTDKREQYYLYVGRLSEEKGVKTLLEVASKLPYRLKVAGGGPLLDELKIKYANKGNIEFLGHQNASQVSELLASAVVSVVPSECYENNPLSAIESLCAGTPVIGAKIGGVPELIGEGDGFIFESGNKIELGENINKAFSCQWNNEKIKEKSIERFSSERYFELIQKVY
ncbi:MAG: glycosyltransferase [Bacteroidales bacterium]|nr:glycosyltransferase [Bacteroidales bacterium]